MTTNEMALVPVAQNVSLFNVAYFGDLVSNTMEWVQIGYEHADDPDLVQQAMTIINDNLAQLQAVTYAAGATMEGAATMIAELEDQRDELVHEIELIQESYADELEQGILDRCEWLAQEEDRSRIEELANEIANGAGLEMAVEYERSAMERRLTAAMRLAEEMVAYGQ